MTKPQPPLSPKPFTQLMALQNRGRSLSKIESIKSYLILQVQLHGRDKTEITHTLEAIEREMNFIYQTTNEMKEGEDEVIDHYWRSCSGKGFDSEELLSEVKERFAEVTSAHLDTILDFFKGLSHAFTTVKSVEQDPRPVFTHLRYFNRLELAYPFFILARRIDPDCSLLLLATLLENITFRSQLRGRRADIEIRLSHALCLLAEHDMETLLTTLVDYLQCDEWLSYWNDNFMQERISGLKYRSPRNKTILWRYELSLSGRRRVRLVI